MFEIAELGHAVKKSVYKEKIPELRTQLLLAQEKVKNSDFSVIILISGVDGGGKGNVINLLNEWMDARYMRTVAFGKPSDEESERPKFWRYWRTLPAKGAIGVYVGSWYSDPLSGRVYGKIDDNQLQHELIQIRQLEQELIDGGTLIIKCWLHLKKSGQKSRLKMLEKNPDTQWQVTERDKKHLEMYDDFVTVAENMLTETSTGDSPWLIVDGSDIRYSSLTVGKHILNRIEQHIHFRENNSQVVPLQKSQQANMFQQNLLDSLDLSLKLDKSSYNAKLSKYQGKLNKLSRQAQELKKSSILVFEGWDAGGKGGAIRRLTHAIDARNYRVIPVAAPTDEEKMHHYLWRFWRHIPRAGQVTIYDRSWYGRVLVERVEGFASKKEWKQAYSEIVNFEEAMSDHGTLLLKFWLHIDKDEQLARFKEREQISYKKHKITEDDYRNREKWDEYNIAVNEMVTRTSTQKNPWIIVEANDKKYARVKVLKAYCQQLEKMLDGEK
ncbi:MAG: polyphosphate:AMP phosphotransferase [Methanosarcinales archaeon]|nr:polyphosphate:AMP phosphotransferase [Methanosarcinales archaeon]